MRFYRRADDAVLEIRRPLIRFFLLGPFYLLWLRLWREATVVGIGVAALVHGAMVLTRSATGVSGGLDVGRAFAAIDTLRAATSRGVQADETFRQLFAMLLPYYAAALTLLCAMAVLTAVFPYYLGWCLARRGWEPLDEDTVEPESLPIHGF